MQDERLGDGEQADEDRDQRHAVVELEEPERRARRAVDRIGADGADHQAEEAGDEALDQVLGRDRGDQGQPEHHDDDHLDAAEVETELAERRQHGHRRDRGDESAEGRGREAQDERLLRLPFAGHRIAVEGGRGGAAFARHVEQDGRYAAAELRRAVERDHERHPRLDAHVQGERQEDDERVLGAEAGQDPDHDAEQHAGDDHPP